MSYEEWKTFNGFTYKEWRNEEGLIHREDGPAFTTQYPDGSTSELFHFNGEYLGYNGLGFWVLWGMLTEEQRKAPNLLKCLARYS
jgi:hypothetical protein